MRAMTEAEFMREIGFGNNSEVVVEALAAFHRSHGHDDIADVVQRMDIHEIPDNWFDPAGEEERSGDIGEFEAGGGI